MRWALLLVVLASLRADAKPVRFDRDDEIDKPLCRSSGSWKKFSACQLRGATFELLQDLEKVKLVSIASAGTTRVSKRLELYVLANGVWTKSSFFVETSATSELLDFQSLPPDAYQLDVGFANQTWVTVDEVNTRPAIIKRRITYVCQGTGGCRSVQSSCDVIVHGKAVATFRGVPQWDGNGLKVRGDGRNTNRYCPKPPQLIDASIEP